MADVLKEAGLIVGELKAQGKTFGDVREWLKEKFDGAEVDTKRDVFMGAVEQMFTRKS
jgi:hypothetical protein